MKSEGDAAVFAYTEKFDHANIDASNTSYVTEEEIKEAYEKVDEELIDVIRKASIANIQCIIMRNSVQNSWFDSKPDGTILGQKVTRSSDG